MCPSRDNKMPDLIVVRDRLRGHVPAMLHLGLIQHWEHVDHDVEIEVGIS